MGLWQGGESTRHHFIGPPDNTSHDDRDKSHRNHSFTPSLPHEPGYAQMWALKHPTAPLNLPRRGTDCVWDTWRASLQRVPMDREAACISARCRHYDQQLWWQRINMGDEAHRTYAATAGEDSCAECDCRVGHRSTTLD